MKTVERILKDTGTLKGSELKESAKLAAGFAKAVMKATEAMPKANPISEMLGKP